MQGCGIKQNKKGSVFIIVLIFLFVMTMIVVSNSQNLIINQKMQHAMQHDFVVFLRAEAGMQQRVLEIQGDNVDLPDSPIALETHVKNIKIDPCGNQTVTILSIAQDDFDKVILNSRDIFARVPREKDCQRIPAHQCVWWKIKQGT